MKINKLQIIVNFLRLSLVAAIFISVFYSSWYNLLISFATLLLTFFPVWLEKKYRINIPLDFEFVIIFFVYASLFLGEIGRFYDRFWWWDIFLHSTSAIALGFVGFIILFFLLKAKRITSYPGWAALFSFCFALSIGAFWEIFEFSMDQLFGFNMQKSGLTDTMWDLIVDFFGALLTSLLGYAYLKGSQRSFFVRLIKMFLKNNHNFSEKI
jgi:hypothetical protein